MKALLKLIVFLVVVVLVAVGGALFYLDQIAKEGIERGATYALGVDTEVDSVSLRLLKGEFGMSGFSVSNPAGFSEPTFLSVGAASLSVPPEQLREDVVRVPRIAISDVDLTILSRSGKANYDQILENLRRFESIDEPAEEASASGKQLIIDELVVTDIAAKVTVGLLGEGATVDLKIPEIRMTNLGSDSGGLTTAELTNVITKAVLDAVIRSGGMPTDIAKDLTGQLGKLANVDIKLPAGLGQAAGALLQGGKESDVSGNIGGVIDGLMGGFGKKKE